MKQATLELIDTGLAPLNAARAALGLPPLAHVTDQLDPAEILYLGTSKAFDFPVDDLPAKLRYVGPQLADLVGSHPGRRPGPRPIAGRC